jgi:hypothetical protein
MTGNVNLTDPPPQPEVSTGPATAKDEIGALNVIADALEPLDRAAQQRAATWVADRYGAV